MRISRALFPNFYTADDNQPIPSRRYSHGAAGSSDASSSLRDLFALPSQRENLSQSTLDGLEFLFDLIGSLFLLLDGIAANGGFMGREFVGNSHC